VDRFLYVPLRAAMISLVALIAVLQAVASDAEPDLSGPNGQAGIGADEYHALLDRLERLESQYQTEPSEGDAVQQAQDGADEYNQSGLANTADPAVPGDQLEVQPRWIIDFKDGALFKTDDDQFSLRINNLLQADYRNFSQTAQGAHNATGLQDNFSIAREWLYFRGNVTEYVDYQVVFNTGVQSNNTSGAGTLNVLDAFVDFNPFGSEAKEYFQIRLGRFKTPFLYQFYNWSPMDFLTPELSMFGTNFFQNWQNGLMVHGLLADKRIDYAAGIFNGQPNTFEATQSSRDGIFYLGLAPFLLDEQSPLQNLNLVASAVSGAQFGAANPASLGTAVPSAGPPSNVLISPTFLTFSPSGGVGGAGATTVQNGSKNIWDFEVLWAVQSLNLYAEYNGGNSTYAIQGADGRIVPGTTAQVPLTGYSIAGSYFLTGESISASQRRRIKPLRPCKIGEGLGAFEAFTRYSLLTLGSNVFTDHLANPDIFANSVRAWDTGLN
jgi:phosphate-selective porin OprO/OprP